MKITLKLFISIIFCFGYDVSSSEIIIMPLSALASFKLIEQNSPICFALIFKSLKKLEV